MERAQWYVLIDDDLYIEPDDELCHQTRVGKPLGSYCSFFTVDYMASLFRDATVHPPVSTEWQRCCILKKTGESLSFESANTILLLRPTAGKSGLEGCKILDYSGNVGGLLVSAGNHVDHDDYIGA